MTHEELSAEADNTSPAAPADWQPTPQEANEMRGIYSMHAAWANDLQDRTDILLAVKREALESLAKMEQRMQELGLLPKPSDPPLE